MDFQLTINIDYPDGKGHPVVYEQLFDTFHPMLDVIHRELAQWNGESPEAEVTIKVRKVKNDTDTLGVVANDQSKADDKFGRP